MMAVQMSPSRSPQAQASDGVQDKFYTRPDVAAAVVGLIPPVLLLGGPVVEPSAGNGSFLPFLPPGTLAYDIEPEAGGIVRADWFDVSTRFDRGILVGNPPFGRRSSLARRFIQHGIALGVSSIAFVLPATFRKLTAQRAFPAEWRLVVDSDLPEKIFTHVKGDVSIPCVFQVWTREPETVLSLPDLRKFKPAQPEEYVFLPRGDHRADLCLNGNNGALRIPAQVTNPKAEHYIRICSDDRDWVIARLRGLDLDFHSSVSGGVAWVSQAEINEAWWRGSGK